MWRRTRSWLPFSHDVACLAAGPSAALHCSASRRLYPVVHICRTLASSRCPPTAAHLQVTAWDASSKRSKAVAGFSLALTDLFVARNVSGWFKFLPEADGELGRDGCASSPAYFLVERA